MDLYKALQELANEITQEVIRRLRSPIGINPRTGDNTLIGSNLEESIDTYIDNGDLVFKIADYYSYVVTGWRRTGNFPNTAHIFLINILDWIRRKHVRMGNLTENQIAWYLYKRMLIEGREIKPRPFIEYGESADEVLPFLEDFFNKWAEKVFDNIVSEIKLFNK